MTLAHRIEYELTAQLAARESLPFRLTLAGIAKHFQVSPMPVRIAVDSLIEKGLLTKQDNGRMQINADALPDPAEVIAPTQRVSETDLDRSVTEYIVMRSLTQDEHYLREKATAEHFGVGRTVVRRVFSRLSGMGLIEHVHRCGWLVRPYREQDTIDYLTVRETLELKALELAKHELEPAVLQAMLDANASSDEGDEVELDDALHSYIIEKSGSRYIHDFFARNSAYYAAIFNYAALEPDARREMAGQHRDILRALISGDFTTAKRSLSRHILAQRDNVSRMIKHLSTHSSDADSQPE